MCLCKPQGSGVLAQRCGSDTECPNIYVFPKLARWFQVGTNAYLNSGDFPARDGGGLAALAQALHQRCAQVVELQGGRLRT